MFGEGFGLGLWLPQKILPLQEIKEKNSNNHSPKIPKETILTTKNAIENLLNVSLPNWSILKKQSEKTIKEKQPDSLVQWMGSELPIAKRHIKKGCDYDLWKEDEQLILRTRPSIIEKIIYAILSLFSVLLKPWYAVKLTFEKLLEKIAEKIGPLFAVFALPAAFIVFLTDLISMVFEFILSVPRLIFSPFTLIRSILLFIPILLTKFIARLIWALFLPVIGKILSGAKIGNAEPMQKLMKKYHWIRYVLLGFFRKERPADAIILIPAKTVTQVLIVKRNWFFNRGEYLIVVEGEKLVSGLMKRFSSCFFSLMLPFYWERTVHILRLPKESDAKNKIINIVSLVLKQPIQSWK